MKDFIDVTASWYLAAVNECSILCAKFENTQIFSGVNEDFKRETDM